MKRLAVLTALATFSFAIPSQAVTLWGTNASACTPLSGTTSAKRHKSGATSVEFASGKTGEIVLICPVAKYLSGTGAWKIAMTYSDSTGPGTSASVKAQVFKLGQHEISPTLLGTVVSESSPSTNDTTLNSESFAHQFFEDDSAYWVRITLKRNATSKKVKIHSVFIIEGTI